MRAILFTLAISIANAQPKFEVASVKPVPAPLEQSSMRGGPLPVGPFNQSGNDPGRITWNNVWLLRILQVAYDLPQDRISAPDWFKSERYNIIATVPEKTSGADFRKMVQALLADRFKLTVHRETKEVSGYILEVAKKGPKLIKSNPAAPIPLSKEASCQGCNALVAMDANGFPAPRPGNPIFPPGSEFEDTFNVDGRFRATVLNATMPTFAAFLTNVLKAPVQDRTNLQGTYDARFEYLPDGSPNTDPAPILQDAVQSQLGLKLTAKKVPVETLVVDHAEKVPVEN